MRSITRKEDNMYDINKQFVMQQENAKVKDLHQSGELSQPKQCALFRGEKGRQTAINAGVYDEKIFPDRQSAKENLNEQVKFAFAMEQPIVSFIGSRGNILRLLDGDHNLLVHNTEKESFVCEQMMSDGDGEQAAFVWNEISEPEDVERLAYVRGLGKIQYIDPREHAGATDIFLKSSKPTKDTYNLELVSEMIRIPGNKDFAYQEGWLYSLEEGTDKAIKLVSASIVVESIDETINYQGNVNEALWKIKISVAGYERKCEIPEDELATELLKILNKMPGVQFGTRNRVNTSILNYVRTMAVSARHELILIDSGWQMIEDEMLYLHDGHSKIEQYSIKTSKEISRLANVNAADIFMRAVRIFDDRMLAGPLLLYSLYGVTFRPFLDAGIEPQTILFLCGPTGCRKTSVVRIIYRIFNDEIAKKPLSFQSSLGSLDDLINRGRDPVIVLDDFAPNTGNCNEMEMYTKLEKVVRLFGDGSDRQVLDSNHQARTVAHVQGGAVVTGEISGRAKSSLLRMLTVEMDYSSINLSELQRFQDERKLWPTFINAFVTFLEETYADSVRMLQSTFVEFRKLGATLYADGRIVDHFSILMSLLQLLQKFLKIHGVGEVTITELAQLFEAGIRQACQHSEDLANDKDSWAYYLEALWNVLMSMSSQVAPDKQHFEQNPHLLGYKGKGGLVYFKADLLEQSVRTYLNEKDKAACFLSNREAFGILAEHRLIRIYQNGNEKHTYTISAKSGGISNRLVAIYLDRLYDEVVKLS